MIKGVQVFNYISKNVGVTKDGEQYVAINVLTEDNRN